jgi:hypothetical protein
LISNSVACRGSSKFPLKKPIARPTAWASKSVHPSGYLDDAGQGLGFFALGKGTASRVALRYVSDPCHQDPVDGSLGHPRHDRTKVRTRERTFCDPATDG